MLFPLSFCCTWYLWKKEKLHCADRQCVGRGLVSHSREILERDLLTYSSWRWGTLECLVTPGSQERQQQSLWSCFSVFTCKVFTFPWGTEIFSSSTLLCFVWTSKENWNQVRASWYTGGYSQSPVTSFMLFAPGNMRQPWKEATHRRSQKCLKNYVLIENNLWLNPLKQT